MSNLKCVNCILYISCVGQSELRKPRGCAMMNQFTNYFDFVKSNDKKSIFSNQNIKQLIMMITDNAKMESFNFANPEQSEIAKIYARMYFSLAIVRWCRGETLGVARQKAMEQMDNFMQSKSNSKNPADKYLTEFKKQFHAHMAKINVEDTKNAKRHIDIESAKNIQGIFAKEFQNNLKSLNEMSQNQTIQSLLGAESVAKPNQQKTQPLTPQQHQEIINKFIMEQLMRQRAA